MTEKKIHLAQNVTDVSFFVLSGRALYVQSHIALVSPSLCRTSAPIQFTIVLVVLGTQETLKKKTHP